MPSLVIKSKMGTFRLNFTCSIRNSPFRKRLSPRRLRACRFFSKLFFFGCVQLDKYKRMRDTSWVTDKAL